MKSISAWPWKDIWQALGVLAILLSMAYSPYLLLSGRLDRMDRRLEAIDDKLANIDKRLAVVEDRVGVTAPRVPARSDSALAPRAGTPPAAVSALDAEPTPLSARLSRRFVLSGARLLCDILPVVPGGAFLQAGYARSCQACAIGASG